MYRVSSLRSRWAKSLLCAVAPGWSALKDAVGWSVEKGRFTFLGESIKEKYTAVRLTTLVEILECGKWGQVQFGEHFQRWSEVCVLMASCSIENGWRGRCEDGNLDAIE